MGAGKEESTGQAPKTELGPPFGDGGTSKVPVVYGSGQPRARQQGSRQQGTSFQGLQVPENSSVTYFPKVPERKDSTSFNRLASSSGSLSWNSLSHITPREETNAQAVGQLQGWGLLGILWPPGCRETVWPGACEGPSSTPGQDRHLF